MSMRSLICNKQLLCISTNNLQRIYKRYFKKIKRGPDPEIVKSMPVFQYAPDTRTTKKRKFIFLWGFTLTGALGKAEFVKRPQLFVNRIRPPLKTVYRPWKSNFVDRTTEVYDIACGYGFTVVCADVGDSTHKLFGCGLNTDSQIGCHEEIKGHPLTSVLQFVPIPLPIAPKTKVVKVSCGRAHTVCLTNDVFSLGNNAFGQCGRNIIEDEVYLGNSRVHQIQGIDGKVNEIVCGCDHTLFLTEKGEVYSCGWGADGQTGLGHFRNQSVPTKVRGDIEGENITCISSAADCVLASNDKGDVFGWGNSEYSQFHAITKDKQLSVPRHLKLENVGKIVKVAAGGTVCAILNERGNVFVWGYGILGKGPNVDQLSKPSMLPMPLFGYNELNTEIKVVNIVAGLNHFAALTNNGDLFSWGKNKGGCLGLGNDNDQYFPLRVFVPVYVQKVSLGVDHTAIIGTSAI